VSLGLVASDQPARAMERFRRIGVHEDAHANGVWCVAETAVAGSSTFVTGGADGAIRLWSLNREPGVAVNGSTDHSAQTDSVGTASDTAQPASTAQSTPLTLTATLNHHALGVVAIAVASAATTAASTSLDGTLKIWDTAKPEIPARAVTGNSGNITEVWAVAISADGARVVTAGAGGSVQVIDASMALVDNVFNYDPEAPAGTAPMCLSAALSADGSRVALAAHDGTVRVFDVESGKPLTSKLEGHSAPVRSIAFIPGDPSAFVSCSDDCLVNLFDIEAGRVVVVLRGHTGMVMSVAPSPCGKYVTSGSADRKVKVWEIKTRECIYSTSGHTDTVWGIAYASKGKHLISVADDQSIAVIDSEHADLAPTK
jgi:WD repeat-containing protein 61